VQEQETVAPEEQWEKNASRDDGDDSADSSVMQ